LFTAPGLLIPFLKYIHVQGSFADGDNAKKPVAEVQLETSHCLTFQLFLIRGFYTNNNKNPLSSENH
jgi:hypothetical protein